LAEAKSISVSFPSGRELLNSYWGLLANGGLVLGESQGLREGDNVALQVTIESSQQQYKLNGHVVRRPPAGGTARERVVIAFDPGEPHDLLLSAAWAETENVPARRQRRFPIDAQVGFRHPDHNGPAAGKLVNLSYGGCCLRVARSLDHDAFGVGKPLVLVSEQMEVEGVVRWATGSCRGIEFQGVDSGAVEKFVKRFL
jgi:Tfp pilus assembly protein PilZ